MGKSVAMTEFLDHLSINEFGRSRSRSLRRLVCVRCGGEARIFDDERSSTEYEISGLCQDCQDKIFKDKV
jgi:hypothetical protein